MHKYFMKDKSKNKTSFGFKEVDSDKKADLVGSVFDTVSKNYDPVSYTHLTLPTIYSV